MDEKALQGIRVLDLAGPIGVYCGKMYADLGADVIKVESPGGDPMRNISPFYHDEVHPEKSLYWWHFNTNKKSITLNLNTGDGREILKRLVKTVDIMIETFPVGHLLEIGLGYPVLREVNPGLILVSITPFGQTGPYRHFKGSDIVGVAMAGQMYLAGYPDGPPNRIGGSQGYHQASMHAACASLIACYYKSVTGEGQQVDVSMYESCLISLWNAMHVFDSGQGQISKRIGNLHRTVASDVWECKDGYCNWLASMPGYGLDILVQWMDRDGMAGGLNQPQVLARLMDTTGPKDPALVEHFNQFFGPWCLTKSQKEIFAAQERSFGRPAPSGGIVVTPVNNVRDLLEDSQLIYNGFFTPVKHPELGETITYPGAPYIFSGTPWAITRRSPLIGEHNTEVYEKELGFTREQLLYWRQAGVI